MKHEQHYKCPTCGATKTIKQHRGPGPKSLFPDTVLCGVRDCEDHAVRVVSLD